jgi:hypothetical protein
MLPGMPSVTIEAMRQVSRLNDFPWSDDELAALRAAVERALETLAGLERLPLRDVEPTTVYRVR